MILRDATIKYKDYDPDKLGLKSTLRICVSCDSCGRVRWNKKQDYTKLCRSCAQKGKIVLDETKKKIGDANRGRGGINLICEMCGKEYKVQPYRKNISIFCSKKCLGKWRSINKSGKNSPCYGRIFSDEEIQKRSGINHPFYGKFGKDNPNWKGGFDTKRPYVLPIYRCNQLNSRFKGSEGHHVNKNIVVFIPKELHKHIYHEIQTGLNMGEINALAIQFINGEL